MKLNQICLKIKNSSISRSKTKNCGQKGNKIRQKSRKLSDNMLHTMYDANGIGLAATQVDEHIRLVVMDLSEGRNEPMVFVNPEYEVQKSIN